MASALSRGTASHKQRSENGHPIQPIRQELPSLQDLLQSNSGNAQAMMQLAQEWGITTPDGGIDLAALQRKMEPPYCPGTPCGFDVFPPLKPTLENKQRYQAFVEDVLEAYGTADNKRKVMIKSYPSHLEFLIGHQHPILPLLPLSCDYFLRFSTDIDRNGISAYPIILGVCRIAALYFGGDPIHMWSKTFDGSFPPDPRDLWLQWGFYHSSEVERAYQEMAATDFGRYDKNCGGSKLRSINNSMINSGPLFAIQSIPGKGKGVIALANIPRGTRLISERPLVTLTRMETPLQLANRRLIEDVSKLSKSQQWAFFSLHSSGYRKLSHTWDIAETNNICMDNEFCKENSTGVFFRTSRFNHSCRNNVSWTWNHLTGVLNVHTNRNIAKGEELFGSYEEPAHPFAQRQERLKRVYGFDCICSICSLSSEAREASDKRLHEAKAAWDMLPPYGKVPPNAQIGPICVRKYYEVAKREGLQDRFYTAYTRAAFYASTKGDVARYKAFSLKAYEEQAALLGHDDRSTANAKHNADINPSWNRGFNAFKMRHLYSEEVPKGLSEQEFEDWLWADSK